MPGSRLGGALEQAGERLSDKPVELGRQGAVRRCELAQVQEQVGKLVAALGATLRFHARDALEIPQVPALGLERALWEGNYG